MRVSFRPTVLALGACVLLAGCGGSKLHSAEPDASTVRAAFAGSPAPLAALHAQANRLLPGGPSAFRARLRALRGHPVVVNVWGSWCEPCQSEFPIFQKTSVRYGKRIAFLGVDEKDETSAAAAFLKRFPLSYPSYVDPHAAIVSSLKTYGATPQTFFYNARGVEQYDHAGPYTSVASLGRDIRQYLGQ